MKTSTACIGALSLASLVAAQPSGHRKSNTSSAGKVTSNNQDPGRHQVLHQKRDYATTVTDIVTDYLPEVIVYVDENGNILYEVTVGGGQVATSTPSSSVAASTPATSSAEATSVYVAPTSSSTSTSVYIAPSSSVSTVAAFDPIGSIVSAAASILAPLTSASSSSAAPTSTGSSSSGSAPAGYGITYSPYTDSGDCKTAEEVAGDFESITGYDFVRTYGVDCNQVANVLAACKTKNMKLMLGVYDITETASAIQTIIEVIVDDDWEWIDTIAIGNEGVNDGTYTVSAVVEAIGVAKSLLSAVGFGGSLVTVDTFVATIANPELCQNSDYAAVNAHAFFDGGVTAANAGPWVLEQMQRVSEACGGKTTWITETGWPTQGETNGDAIPGESEQAAALASIRSSLSSNVIFFNAFNDLWKTNSASTFDAEQYWGIYGDSKFSKR